MTKAEMKCEKYDRLSFQDDIVMPSLEDLFRERGIELHGTSPDVRCYHHELRQGLDSFSFGSLAIGDCHVVMVCVRTELNREDVDEHIERLNLFRRYFHEYKERKLLGAVAGIVIEEGVDRYAYQQGLFVIGQRGDTVRLLNDAGFQPKEW